MFSSGILITCSTTNFLSSQSYQVFGIWIGIKWKSESKESEESEESEELEKTSCIFIHKKKKKNSQFFQIVF